MGAWHAALAGVAAVGVLLGMRTNVFPCALAGARACTPVLAVVDGIVVVCWVVVVDVRACGAGGGERRRMGGSRNVVPGEPCTVVEGGAYTGTCPLLLDTRTASAWSA